MHQTKGPVKRLILEVVTEDTNTVGIGSIVHDFYDHFCTATQADCVVTPDARICIGIRLFVSDPDTGKLGVNTKAAAQVVGVGVAPHDFKEW